MKKIIFALFLVISLLALCSCTEDKYPPVESSDEEARVIYTLKIEDKEYHIRYELYRALFLNNKSVVDGGNSAVWSGPDTEKYIDEINEIIIGNAAEIFSVFHLANDIGYDPYSSKVDYEVEELFISDIESTPGSSEDAKYSAFLENLKKNNLNYAVADLLYRYALAEEAIDEYYRTEYEYSREAVKEYYDSDGCARILQAYFQAGIKSYADMQTYRDELLEAESDYSLAVKIIGSTAANESDLIDNGELSGIMLGKRALSQREYSSYVNEIFSLSDGELSSVISLKNTNADGYYIVYRLAKSDSHFETFYPAIANSYLDDIAGGVLGGMEIELINSLTVSESYGAISHKDISMN